MRRKVVAVWMAVLLLTVPTVVYAHVIGAFKDFLVDITDEQATARLVEELEDTRQQIESLSPRVERLNEAFAAKQDEQLPMLQFYQSIGTDVLLSFIFEADSIVDVMANMRMVEMKLDEDLSVLNRLYMEYMQVKQSRDALSSYEELLTMIEANLRSREQFMETYGHLEEEEIAAAAEELWAKEANVLDEVLLDDRKIIDRRIHQVTSRANSRAPYRIENEVLNQYTNLTYYIQSDHVYMHYAKNQLDIILIGIVSRDDTKTASLKLEAGFMNGIRIAEMYMDQMVGFAIDYSKLNPGSTDFYVEQTNGALVIMPVELTGE